MSKYLIIHSRWIRGSTQSGEFVVGEATRKKEARGLTRHNFNSTLEMITKHQFPADDWLIDEDANEVVLGDIDGVYYRSKFFALEIND